MPVETTQAHVLIAAVPGSGTSGQSSTLAKNFGKKLRRKNRFEEQLCPVEKKNGEGRLQAQGLACLL